MYKVKIIKTDNSSHSDTIEQLWVCYLVITFPSQPGAFREAQVKFRK